MSGGDSGGYGGGYTSQKDCDNLFIKVRLSSVNESIIEELSVSDILSIALLDNSIVAQKGSDIAGSIASREIIDLLECIKEGKAFIATVVEVNDGKCIVNVAPERAA